MSDVACKTPSKRATGWASWETWAIAILLFGGGFGAGFPIGQKVLRDEAEHQVKAVEQAYNEASDAKDELIQQCLYRAGAAASTAAGAAEQAKEAAETAKSAAEAVTK